MDRHESRLGPREARRAWPAQRRTDRRNPPTSYLPLLATQPQRDTVIVHATDGLPATEQDVNVLRGHLEHSNAEGWRIARKRVDLLHKDAAMTSLTVMF